jgi:hypothetical protein
VEEEDAADEEEPPATRVVAMRMDRFIVDRFTPSYHSNTNNLLFLYSIVASNGSVVNHFVRAVLVWHSKRFSHSKQRQRAFITAKLSQIENENRVSVSWLDEDM